MMKCGDKRCHPCYSSGYEQEDIQFLRNFLLTHKEKRSAFIDVGAHAGLYVRMMTSSLPDCRMLSIEPDISMSDALYANTSPHVVMNVALWDRVVNLYLHKDNKPHGYVDEKADGISVSGTTLDLLHKTCFSDIEVLGLKIDTEGSEGLVLAGGRDTLKSIGAGAIVVELSMGHLRKYNTDVMDIIDNLGCLGFEPTDPIVIEEVRNGNKRNVHFVKG